MTTENYTLAWKIRAVRESFLKDTDYIVLINAEAGTDVPQNWIDYRQALRDVPEQEGFPDSITWPTKPE